MGQQIYFHLPRMNTAEKWLSLHHPALERATFVYRRMCPLSSGPSQLNSTVSRHQAEPEGQNLRRPASFRCVGDVKDDRRGEAQQHRNMRAEAPKLSPPRPVQNSVDNATAFKQKAPLNPTDRSPAANAIPHDRARSPCRASAASGVIPGSSGSSCIPRHLDRTLHLSPVEVLIYRISGRRLACATRRLRSGWCSSSSSVAGQAAVRIPELTWSYA
jgi:hypothetical protein